jgi:hypothetical protein
MRLDTIGTLNLICDSTNDISAVSAYAGPFQNLFVLLQVMLVFRELGHFACEYYEIVILQKWHLNSGFNI